MPGHNKIIQKILYSLYHSRLRSIIRRLKVIHFLLKLKEAILSFYFRLNFLFLKRNVVSVFAGGHKADFLVSSFKEFRRIKAIGSEKKILRFFLEKIRLGDVVCDIGASIGLYTIFLAKAVGESGLVMAFEPEERSHQRLIENIRFNSLDNIKIFKNALSNEQAKKELIVDQYFVSGVHSFAKVDKNVPLEKIQKIETTTGDIFISENALPFPNVIKIDVEGMEYEVLLGLSSILKTPQCRLILCEVHFSILESRGTPNAPQKIENLLKEFGFNKIKWLDYSHLLVSKE